MIVLIRNQKCTGRSHLDVKYVNQIVIIKTELRNLLFPILSLEEGGPIATKAGQTLRTATLRSLRQKAGQIEIKACHCKREPHYADYAQHLDALNGLQQTSA